MPTRVPELDADEVYPGEPLLVQPWLVSVFSAWPVGEEVGHSAQIEEVQGPPNDRRLVNRTRGALPPKCQQSSV
jgi:hypothetical protein